MGVEAQKFQVLADVLMSALAGGTLAAMIQWSDDHCLSGFKTGNSRTDGGDRTGHFVANDAMFADALVHMAEIDMVSSIVLRLRFVFAADSLEPSGSVDIHDHERSDDEIFQRLDKARQVFEATEIATETTSRTLTRAV